MNSWGEFYYLCGSSAAGLTGLMFIAVTFGSRLITKEKLPQAEAFLSPICYHFIQVFFLCCVALAPTAGPRILGLSIAATAAYRLLRIPRNYSMIKAASRESSSEIETSDWIISLILPGVVYAVLIAAGLAYIFEAAFATSLFAVSLISLLMLGVRGAWDTLLWIATKVD